MLFNTKDERISTLERKMELAMKCIDTLQNAVLLMGVSKLPENDKPLKERPIHKHRKHKKHNFPRTCEICWKPYKGNIGIAIHLSRVHGIRGKYVTKMATKSN